MDFPKEHLGHSYGPAPTNSELGINLPPQLQQEPVKPDDHIVAAVKKLLADGCKGDKLWEILTALRGPDDRDEAAKNATTAVIRHTLGLKQYDTGLFISHPDDVYFVKVRTSLPFNHFTLHTMDAFEALGLKWSEVNK